LAAWLRLCDELVSQGYDEVVDLHGSLRTRSTAIEYPKLVDTGMPL
jgi:ADP-heptose:LPS heptosyltransferase